MCNATSSIDGSVLLGYIRSKSLSMGCSFLCYSEQIGTDIREVLAQRGHLHAPARDTHPDTALWEIKCDAQAQNQDNRRRPDEDGTGVFRHKQDRGFAGAVQCDLPLFIETGQGLPWPQVDQYFVLANRRARDAGADQHDWVPHLGELLGWKMPEQDADRHICTGNRYATGVIHGQGGGDVGGLIEHDWLIAEQAAAGIADGDVDRRD